MADASGDFKTDNDVQDSLIVQIAKYRKKIQDLEKLVGFHERAKIDLERENRLVLAEQKKFYQRLATLTRGLLEFNLKVKFISDIEVVITEMK